MVKFEWSYVFGYFPKIAAFLPTTLLTLLRRDPEYFL